MSKKISRRQFLRGAGGFLLPLPFLASMAPRKAFAGTSTPLPDTWAATMVIHNSVPNEAWFVQKYWNADPKTAGRIPGTGPVNPLNTVTGADIPTVFRNGWAKWASSMCLPVGVYLKGPKPGHHCGSVNWGGTRVAGWDTAVPEQATIDMVFDNYCQSVGIKKPFNLLCLNPGANVESGNMQSFSHVIGQDPVPAYDNPQVLWDLIFKGRTSSGSSSIDPRLKVVDIVLADANSLKTKLNSVDKLVLDAFMSGLSTIQNRLNSLSGASVSACTVPSRPTIGATNTLPLRDANITANLHALIDISTMAAYCGLNRWISIANTNPMNMGGGDQHNDSHGGPRTVQIDYTTYAIDNSFFYLAQAMKSLPTSDGLTMLDHGVAGVQMENNGSGVFHSMGVTDDNSEQGIYTALIGGNGIPKNTQYHYVANGDSASNNAGMHLTGIWANSLWNYFLLSMGVPRSYFEQASRNPSGLGYGNNFLPDPKGSSSWYQAQLDNDVPANNLAGKIPPGFIAPG